MKFLGHSKRQALLYKTIIEEKFKEGEQEIGVIQV